MGGDAGRAACPATAGACCCSIDAHRRMARTAASTALVMWAADVPLTRLERRDRSGGGGAALARGYLRQ